MARYTLDFIFDEKTGESRIVIDFQDDSLSTLEINENIRSGELRERIVELATDMYGPEIAEGVRAGRIPVVCLDEHPELDERRRDGSAAQLETEPPLDRRSRNSQGS